MSTHSKQKHSNKSLLGESNSSESVPLRGFGTVNSDPNKAYFMDGWIRLHRKIQDHWIWKDPVKLKWWLDILLTVNHKSVKVNIGYDLIDCNRGQSVMSVSKWAERWGVSRHTVRNFFKLLLKDGMILHKSISKSTQLTVCNYDDYQPTLRNEGQMRDFSGTDEGQMRDTNNNVKNDNKLEKEILKEKESQEHLPEQAEVRIEERLMADLPTMLDLKAKYDHLKKTDLGVALFFAKYMYAALIKKYPDHKTILTATTTRWVADADLLLRVDKITMEKAVEVFNYAMADSFWTSVVRSPANLRKNFDTIRAKMANPIVKTAQPGILETPKTYKPTKKVWTEESILKDRERQQSERESLRQEMERSHQ